MFHFSGRVCFAKEGSPVGLPGDLPLVALRPQLDDDGETFNLGLVWDLRALENLCASFALENGCLTIGNHRLSITIDESPQGHRHPPVGGENDSYSERWTNQLQQKKRITDNNDSFACVCDEKFNFDAILDPDDLFPELSGAFGPPAPFAEPVTQDQIQQQQQQQQQPQQREHGVNHVAEAVSWIPAVPGAALPSDGDGSLEELRGAWGLLGVSAEPANQQQMEQENTAGPVAPHPPPARDGGLYQEAEDSLTAVLEDLMDWAESYQGGSEDVPTEQDNVARATPTPLPTPTLSSAQDNSVLVSSTDDTRTRLALLKDSEWKAIFRMENIKDEKRIPSNSQLSESEFRNMARIFLASGDIGRSLSKRYWTQFLNSGWFRECRTASTMVKCTGKMLKCDPKSPTYDNLLRLTLLNVGLELADTEAIVRFASGQPVYTAMTIAKFYLTSDPRDMDLILNHLLSQRARS